MEKIDKCRKCNIEINEYNFGQRIERESYDCEIEYLCKLCSKRWVFINLDSDCGWSEFTCEYDYIPIDVYKEYVENKTDWHLEEKWVNTYAN